ncbi:hypothetical protein ACRAWD_11525 [Caulobacter segnis]
MGLMGAAARGAHRRRRGAGDHPDLPCAAANSRSTTSRRSSSTTCTSGK